MQLPRIRKRRCRTDRRCQPPQAEVETLAAGCSKEYERPSPSHSSVQRAHRFRPRLARYRRPTYRSAGAGPIVQFVQQPPTDRKPSPGALPGRLPCKHRGGNRTDICQRHACRFTQAQRVCLQFPGGPPHRNRRFIGTSSVRRNSDELGNVMASAAARNVVLGLEKLCCGAQFRDQLLHRHAVQR